MHNQRTFLNRNTIVIFFLLSDSPASEVHTKYKIQTAENHSKERIQHSEHGESLNSGSTFAGH